jgi:hypothetical protein
MMGDHLIRMDGRPLFERPSWTLYIISFHFQHIQFNF